MKCDLCIENKSGAGNEISINNIMAKSMPVVSIVKNAARCIGDAPMSQGAVVEMKALQLLVLCRFRTLSRHEH